MTNLSKNPDSNSHDSSSTSVELKRLQDWKAYIKHFIRTFEALEDHEKDASKFYSKRAKEEVISPFNDQSQLTMLLSQSFNHHRLTHESHLISADTYRAIGKQLSKLKNDVKSKINQFEKASHKQDKEWEKSVDLVHDNAKAYVDSLVSLKSNPSNSPTRDPWLLKRVLESSLLDAEKKSEIRASAASKLSKEFLLFQRQIIDSFKSIVSELVDSKSQSALALGNSLSPIVSGIDPQIEEEQFSMTMGTLPITAHSLPTFSHELQDESVRTLKEGKIQRKTDILKNFTPATGVLTATGFFYVFNENSDTSVHSSFFLPTCTVALGSDPGDFIVQHNGKIHDFKTSSQEDAKAWIATMGEIINGKPEESHEATQTQEVQTPAEVVVDENLASTTAKSTAEFAEEKPELIAADKENYGQESKVRRSFSLFRKKTFKG